MSIVLKQSLNNGDVVRYHRIAEFEIDLSNNVANFSLHSFRNFEHRCLPVTPVCKREYAFILTGEIEDFPSLAYGYIKSLPEFVGAIDA